MIRKSDLTVQIVRLDGKLQRIPILKAILINDKFDEKLRKIYSEMAAPLRADTLILKKWSYFFGGYTISLEFASHF